MTGPDDAPTARPMRADAVRNRARILAAATAAFDAQGTDASLEDVARAAGVGVGTLYRHFPTRLDLIGAVYRASLDAFVARADELREQLPPGEALDTWVLGFVEYALRKRGMASALKEGLGDSAPQAMGDGRARLEAAANRLVASAQVAGAIRGDLEPADLLRAVSGVCLAGVDLDDRASTERVLRLVLDGLRVNAPAPA